VIDKLGWVAREHGLSTSQQIDVLQIAVINSLPGSEAQRYLGVAGPGTGPGPGPGTGLGSDGLLSLSYSLLRQHSVSTCTGPAVVPGAAVLTLAHLIAVTAILAARVPH
jgi:hypothetical protein